MYIYVLAYCIMQDDYIIALVIIYSIVSTAWVSRLVKMNAYILRIFQAEVPNAKLTA